MYVHGTCEENSHKNFGNGKSFCRKKVVIA